MASCKRVLLLYYLAHVAIYDWLSDPNQVLAFFMITLHQHSLAIGLHLNNELLTPYVASFGWVPNFSLFQRPPLGLFPHGRANENLILKFSGAKNKHGPHYTKHYI